MTLKNNPLTRKQDLVVQELNGEVLIYDLKVNKAYCLNKTSSLVWQMCDSNNSIEEISRSLSGKLKTKITEDLVWLSISQFKKDNLLDSNTKIVDQFDGLSRREIIKKIGLASMVSLPLISSLLAPNAAQAASIAACNPIGAPPGTEFQCAPPGFPCATNNPGCRTCTVTQQPSTPGGFCDSNGFSQACVCT